MLMPRKVKHRKQQRGRRRGFAKGGSVVTFGDFGIQALEPAWLTACQIEAARIAMTRHVKRGGKVWIRVFPGQARNPEAGRDPHGIRQGQPRALGCGRKARKGPVRVGRSGPRACKRSHGARDPEASVQSQVRRAPRYPRCAGVGRRPDQGDRSERDGPERESPESGCAERDRRVTKAAELAELDDDELQNRLASARQRVAQPEVPGGDRAARQHRATG